MSHSLFNEHPSLPPFEIFSYSIEKLVEILANRANTSLEDIERKNHCHYFKAYFESEDIDAKTIVVENGYIDKDYLADFSQYYLSCFKHYSKTCTRLHFFNQVITEEYFSSSLSGEIENAGVFLQEHYLGFVVVKPLPETIIGRTCLKIYGSDSGRRHYLGITQNNVSLFGFNLTVDSLPFQEQDKAVAACATSALWSAFHATGHLFQHPILSPSAITAAASKYAPLDSRYFPNSGLNAFQMASAIRNVGLEPYKVNAQSEFVFKTTLFAYLKAGIPVILGFDLLNGSSGERIGKHAVAVTGHSIPEEDASSDFNDFPLDALKIDRIYVHDDGIGPFARMNIDKERFVEGDKQYFSLTTSWMCASDTQACYKAIPEIFLIPLYHKIRIPFQSILNCLAPLISLFSINHIPKTFYPNGLSWEIYLTTNNRLKSELLEEGSLRGESLKTILVAGMPKYIWRALAKDGENKIVDFVFDATDIEQGAFLSNTIHYESNFESLLRFAAQIPEIKSQCRVVLAQFE